MTATVAHAESKSQTEILLKLKASYVLNFIKFTQWPKMSLPADDTPLVIVCIGNPAVASGLSLLLEGKRVHGRYIALRQITTVANTKRKYNYSEADLEQIKSELVGVHAVFMSDETRIDAKTLIQHALPSNVLSIGDSKQFAKFGAMLALGPHDNRLVLYANPQAIEASDVQISSKVLRLAKPVSLE